MEMSPVFNCLCAYVGLDVIYALMVVMFICLYLVNVAKLTAFTMAIEWAVGIVAICLHMCALGQSRHLLDLSCTKQQPTRDVNCAKTLLSLVCVLVGLCVLFGTVPPLPDATHTHTSLNFWIVVLSSYAMGLGLIATK